MNKSLEAILPRSALSGLVGSDLPATPSGLRIAPASFSLGPVSLNGESRLLGPGTRLDATTGGLLAVSFVGRIEQEGLRKGRKLFMLSDFGDQMAQGEYVSAAMSVLENNNVGSNIVSLADIGDYNIAHGAWATKQQLKYEKNAVSVTVVDPGVGTDRKAIAIVTEDNNVLIGPNNGVLYPAAAEHGIRQVYELDRDKIEAFTQRPTTNTFHGRDLFAPAGALAASGIDIARYANPIDNETLIEMELQEKSLLHVDKYGNLKVSDEIPQGATFLRLRKRSGKNVPAVTALLPIYPKFADAKVGTLCAYTGSSGGLEIAINMGNANRFLTSAGFDPQVGQEIDYEFGFDQRKFPTQQRKQELLK